MKPKNPLNRFQLIEVLIYKIIFFSAKDIAEIKAKKNIILRKIDSLVNFKIIFPKIVPNIIYTINKLYS